MNRLFTRTKTRANQKFITNYFNKFQSIYTFSSESFIRSLRTFSIFCGVVTLLISLISLIAWIYNFSFLIGSSVISITPESALAFILASIALIIVQIPSENIYLRFLLRFMRDLAALVVLFIGAVPLLDRLEHVNLILENLFSFLKSFGSSAFTYIPSVSAALFILLGIALLTLNVKLLNHRVSQFFILMAGIILSPTIVGYVYDMQFVYKASMEPSLLSAISFSLLITGLFFVLPERGVMRIIVSESAGGLMARKLLFMTTLTPLLLGAFILAGYRIGWYDTDYRYLLLIVSTIIVYTILVWRNATDMDKIDLERRRSVKHMIFLAAVSQILSSSLSYRTTLKNVAQLAISHIADWCVIDILNDNDMLETVAIANQDNRKIAWAKKMRNSFPTVLKNEENIRRVIRTGKSELYPFITYEMLSEGIKEKSTLKIVTQLNLQSAMVVPLFSQRKALGTMTFLSTNPNLRYTEMELAIAEELSARASLAIENARLYRQAQDATKLRDEFITIASHELKTPLTSLKVYIQVINKQLQKRKINMDNGYLQRMDTQVDRLNKLVEDLLNISRIKAGKMSFDYKDFAIGDLTKEIVETIQPTLEKHKLSLQILDESLVYGDRDRVGQIIINLITNAIKYSPNSDRVNVTVASTDSNKCVVSVEDFGIGIDKKHIVKIFNRFYQVKDNVAKGIPGLGIGLYLSHEIAQRHDGEIRIISKKGKGSTFSLILPCKSDSK